MSTCEGGLPTWQCMTKVRPMGWEHRHPSGACQVKRKAWVDAWWRGRHRACSQKKRHAVRNDAFFNRPWCLLGLRHQGIAQITQRLTAIGCNGAVTHGNPVQYRQGPAPGDETQDRTGVVQTGIDIALLGIGRDDDGGNTRTWPP